MHFPISFLSEIFCSKLNDRVFVEVSLFIRFCFILANTGILKK